MNIGAVILWMLIYAALNYRKPTFKPSVVILIGLLSSLYINNLTLEESIIYQLFVFPSTILVATFYCKGCKVFLGMIITSVWYLFTNTSVILGMDLILPFNNYYYSYEILLSSLILLFLTEMDKNFYKKLIMDFTSGWKIILLNLMFLLTFI